MPGGLMFRYKITPVLVANTSIAPNICQHPSLPRVLFHSSQVQCKWGIIIITILQMTKLRHEEYMELESVHHILLCCESLATWQWLHAEPESRGGVCEDQEPLQHLTESTHFKLALEPTLPAKPFRRTCVHNANSPDFSSLRHWFLEMWMSFWSLSADVKVRACVVG